MKTKTITLKIKIPADYKWLAQETYGEIHLFKNKPKLTKDEYLDLEAPEYWARQREELNVLDTEVFGLNEIEKPTCQKI